VWAKHDYHAAYSSPTLIDLDGQKQCVIFMKKQVIAVNPDNGELFWEYPHITQYDTNASTPIFHEGKNILFCSSAYDSGSRALKLTRDGDKTNVEEVWASKKMEIHHGNAVLIGDSVYGSSGDFGPAFITAIDIETGDVKGKHRDFAKSNFVKVGNRMIVLDEKGRLALASVSPDNFEVLAKAEISDKRCWAAPTLVDTTLYVRDDKKIHAFDLK
jgi:outer membrane protein assembly factor BamB